MKIACLSFGLVIKYIKQSKYKPFSGRVVKHRAKRAGGGVKPVPEFCESAPVR